MKVKFIEATNHGDGGLNWGKFAVMRFEASDRSYPSQIDNLSVRLVAGQGWGPDHLFVLDLATGEGAMFRHGGSARADLNKHKVWVCPMFEPFLVWLYQQDVTDLDALPGLVEFTEAEAPSSFAGYRRPGPSKTT